MGHARALLGLDHASSQQALALRIENEGLSVRETERLVAQLRTKPPRAKPGKKPATGRDAHMRDLEDRIRERLGTKVDVAYQDGKGKVTIRFFSDDDFQRFLEVLGVSQ